MKISAQSHVRPFEVLATCGDFTEVIFNPDKVQFIVGDISGHGSILVKRCADEVLTEFKRIVHASPTSQVQQIPQSVNNPSNKPAKISPPSQTPSLIEQYRCLSQLPNITKYGMNLCLGEFNLQKNTLNYLGVGNMHFLLRRNQTVQSLPINHGVVGILVDEPIEVSQLNLQADDRLMICSDGIDRQAINKTLAHKELASQNCVEQVFQHSSKVKDDAICLCFDVQAVPLSAADSLENV